MPCTLKNVASLPKLKKDRTEVILSELTLAIV